ncbi:serum amyloid P-component-like [Pholidichthys leucotaenia]
MELLLLLLMLTSCAAIPQNLSGKMFVFPEQTNTAHVRLIAPSKPLSAATVCFRSITDLSREHSLFSMATPAADNVLLIFKAKEQDTFFFYTHNNQAIFGGQDYKVNEWQSICGTWDGSSGLVQLFKDGKHSVKKLGGKSTISNPTIILGQDQDAVGGRFEAEQSFVGMMSDVHMWDYKLSDCEIKRYMEEVNFTPGNVLNWHALDFQITGKVLIDVKQMVC